MYLILIKKSLSPFALKRVIVYTSAISGRRMIALVEEKEYGPKTPLAKELMEMKYLLKGETFKEGMSRVANALKDSEEHYHQFRDILLNQRFLPGGRVQSAVGAPRQVTPYNCFVSQVIEDSMD